MYPDWGNEHLSGVAWLASAAGRKALALKIMNARRIKLCGQSFLVGI
jgi:hypothetical protein